MLSLRKWLRAPILACTLCTYLGAHGQVVPTGQSEFTEYVAAKLKQELSNVPVSVKSPLTLSAGQLQVNLDRIYGFCRSNADGCSEEVDGYVKGVSQVIKERNAPLDKSSVRLVIRPTEYIKRAQSSLGPGGPILQSKPFVEGLVIVPVLDSPRAMRPLDNRDLAALSLSQDQLVELGRSNLAATMKHLTEVAKPVSAGQIGTVDGNVFDTSRVLLHSQWTQLAQAQSGTLLVSLPATDVLLYASESTPTAIDALRRMTGRVMSKAPNPLSATVIKWTAGGWELVP